MSNVRRASLVLALLVVAAAVAVVWLLQDADRGAAAQVTSAESADATVASEAVKDTVREVAADASARAYSFAWDTLAEDRAAARELMTTAMQRRYDRTMAGVATSSRRDRTVVAAEVVETALVSATTSYARVLVFVNQSTSADDLREPRLDLDRVLVTLERVDGEWKVSELDAL
jgi:Mce-associated membrane protein